MKIRHIHLEETNSTNDYIKTLALEQDRPATAVFNANQVMLGVLI